MEVFRKLFGSLLLFVYHCSLQRLGELPHFRSRRLTHPQI